MNLGPGATLQDPFHSRLAISLLKHRERQDQRGSSCLGGGPAATEKQQASARARGRGGRAQQMPLAPQQLPRQRLCRTSVISAHLVSLLPRSSGSNICFGSCPFLAARPNQLQSPFPLFFRVLRVWMWFLTWTAERIGKILPDSASISSSHTLKSRKCQCAAGGRSQWVNKRLTSC